MTYEQHDFELNCLTCIIDGLPGEFWWHIGNETDGVSHPTVNDALKAAMKYAAAEEEQNTREYDWRGDIREQERKEARAFGSDA